MGRVSLLLFLAGVVAVALASESEIAELRKELKKYQNILGGLTRQVMMQQLSTEESLRAGGDSGVKQVRASKIGTRPYYESTHINTRSVNAVHDHSQNIRTVGMGEVVVVMNGVEFRTRHNDYKLYQPHSYKTSYHRTEPIELPPVPPAVLNKKTIKGQVYEMKKWFKAWHDQDTKKRDYRPYFKPIMCYLEGAWTQATDDIEEPFESDRHFVDASTWWDLTEKVRFTAYTGSKSNNENYSFLPMKIMNLVNDTEPAFAQWNYRILCAPVKDIPTKYFRPIDDLSARMANLQTLEEYSKTRKARFHLTDLSNPDSDQACRWCYIDQVMEQIPGKDNYRGFLEDNAFGNVAVVGTGKTAGEPLNTAYYHRYFKSSKRGAMGVTHRTRGFSDNQLYMAQTSQTKIPSMKVTDCVEGICTDYVQRWSYAIPLEIIYLTPLSTWNPYNISITLNKRDPKYAAVDSDGRNGGFTPETAYNGNRDRIYYITPEEFFMSSEVEKDPADTSKGVVGVLDSEGNVQRVAASGTRILLPEIPDVGKLRMRYPISPLYNEGSQIYKEGEALKDIVMRMDSFQHMFREKPSGGSGSGGGVDRNLQFEMAEGTKDPPGLHTHMLEIPESQAKLMMAEGTTYEVETDVGNGHSHNLVVGYDKKALHPWIVKSCDGKSACWDEHPLFLEFDG